MVAPADDTSRRLLSALGYVLWPVALIVLLIQESKPVGQRDKVVRHHAYNALGFFVGALILWFLVLFIAWIPVIGWVVLGLYWLLVVVLAIWYALRAYQDQPVMVPLMTEFLQANVKNF